MTEDRIYFSPVTLTGVAVSLTEAVRDLDLEAFESLTLDYQPAQLVGGAAELCLNLAVHLSLCDHGVTLKWGSDPMAWLAFASDHGPGNDRPEHVLALDFLRHLSEADVHREGDPEHPRISVALEFDCSSYNSKFLANALARAVLHMLGLIAAAAGQNPSDVLNQMRHLWLGTLSNP